MCIRRKVSVKGAVQGVAFRKHAARMASELKVNGWVRNCPDGSVEACFEGNRREVEALVSWCFVGPRKAAVEEVIVRHNFYSGTLRGFKILDDEYSGLPSLQQKQRA